MQAQEQQLEIAAPEILAAAHAALDEGSVGHAKSLAKGVLDGAIRDDDKHLEAKALSCLAYADRLLSHFRAGLHASRRAVQLFQSVGDTAGEAGALLTQASCAGVLGRSEEGVEAGLLAVELCRRAGDPLQLGVAHIYLGSALLHARCFDLAKDSFESAVKLGNSLSSPVPEFHALVSLGCSESIRAIVVRHETGAMPDLSVMNAAISRCEQLSAAGQDWPLLKGVQVSLHGLWWLLSAIGKCWSGQPDEAAATMRKASQWAARYGSNTWLDAQAQTVWSEIAQARGDWTAAQEHAMRVIQMGETFEHEQVAAWGQMLACNIHALRGDFEAALRETRTLAARDRRNRMDAMRGRDQVVQWQLDMRRSEQSRIELAASARHLEKLSFEDPLTGLPNRRYFETRAAHLLEDSRGAERPICVALIDVDRFKQVNDGFSHAVGDAVLRQVAAQLRTHVREDDIAARLAGDEFVLALRRTDQRAADEASERIQRAVNGFDWETIAPGLAVTISIGAAQSHEGDTLKDLLDRADSAMYARKRSEPAA